MNPCCHWQILKILNGEPYGLESVGGLKTASGRSEFYLEANSLLASEDFQPNPLQDPSLHSSLTHTPSITAVLFDDGRSASVCFCG